MDPCNTTACLVSPRLPSIWQQDQQQGHQSYCLKGPLDARVVEELVEVAGVVGVDVGAGVVEDGAGV